MNIPMFPRDLKPGCYSELPQPEAAAVHVQPKKPASRTVVVFEQQQQRVDPYRQEKDRQAMLQQPQM